MRVNEVNILKQRVSILRRAMMDIDGRVCAINGNTVTFRVPVEVWDNFRATLSEALEWMRDE
jgi:hypothetical protein